MRTTTRSEVIVIGGGLVGWSTAYRLVRAGLRVAVVDRTDNGQATAAGAGIIAPGTSFRAPEALLPLSMAAVADYPTLLAELAEDGETDTAYETVGALFIARDEDEATRLPEAMRIMAQRRDDGMGNIGALTLLDVREARRLFPPLAADLPGAIFVAGAARVNGRLLRDALRRAAERRGAESVTGNARFVRDGARVTGIELDGESRSSDAVVVAAGAWSRFLGEEIAVRLPISPQRGQIIHLDLAGTDTGRWPIIGGFSSYYLLAFPANRIVAGATRESDAGYDVRMTAGGIHEVLSEAMRVAPGLASATVQEIRIGLRPFSPDQLPILGKAPGLDNVYLCTGHGPVGLQLGPISGAAIVALIRGEAPPFDLAPFSAQRFQTF